MKAFNQFTNLKVIRIPIMLILQSKKAFKEIMG